MNFRWHSNDFTTRLLQLYILRELGIRSTNSSLAIFCGLRTDQRPMVSLTRQRRNFNRCFFIEFYLNLYRNRRKQFQKIVQYFSIGSTST